MFLPFHFTVEKLEENNLEYEETSRKMLKRGILIKKTKNADWRRNSPSQAIILHSILFLKSNCIFNLLFGNISIYM